jgi:hypothetical protein
VAIPVLPSKAILLAETKIDLVKTNIKAHSLLRGTLGNIGYWTPDYNQMGTEMTPQGNGQARPYGLADPTSQAPLMATNSMQSGQDSATSNIGYRGTSGPYRPEAGRADRLGANIVGGTDFDNMASGGYAGGATQRI